MTGFKGINSEIMLVYVVLCILIFEEAVFFFFVSLSYIVYKVSVNKAGVF